jgi:hypothetical protein
MRDVSDSERHRALRDAQRRSDLGVRRSAPPQFARAFSLVGFGSHRLIEALTTDILWAIRGEFTLV